MERSLVDCTAFLEISRRVVLWRDSSKPSEIEECVGDQTALTIGIIALKKYIKA